MNPQKINNALEGKTYIMFGEIPYINKFELEVAPKGTVYVIDAKQHPEVKEVRKGDCVKLGDELLEIKDVEKFHGWPESYKYGLLV